MVINGYLGFSMVNYGYGLLVGFKACFIFPSGPSILDGWLIS